MILTGNKRGKGTENFSRNTKSPKIHDEISISSQQKLNESIIISKWFDVNQFHYWTEDFVSLISRLVNVDC